MDRCQQMRHQLVYPTVEESVLTGQRSHWPRGHFARTRGQSSTRCRPSTALNLGVDALGQFDADEGASSQPDRGRRGDRGLWRATEAGTSGSTVPHRPVLVHPVVTAIDRGEIAGARFADTPSRRRLRRPRVYDRTPRRVATPSCTGLA